jgi:hypothetical protein
MILFSFCYINCQIISAATFCHFRANIIYQPSISFKVPDLTLSTVPQLPNKPLIHKGLPLDNHPQNPSIVLFNPKIEGFTFPVE